jgi:hypothetical protein
MYSYNYFGQTVNYLSQYAPVNDRGLQCDAKLRGIPIVHDIESDGSQGTCNETHLVGLAFEKQANFPRVRYFHFAELVGSVANLRLELRLPLI